MTRTRRRPAPLTPEQRELVHSLWMIIAFLLLLLVILVVIGFVDGTWAHLCRMLTDPGHGLPGPTDPHPHPGPADQRV